MRRSKKRHRGVYLFPNMLTATNLLCGFYSVMSSVQGRLGEASVAILAAAFFDGVDGKVARLTRSSSRFGTEFDSLCDVISFGVAPALLAFSWGLHGHRVGWLAAFLFVVCGALRLARFNSQDGGANSYFQGLPIPAAGCFLATLFLFSRRVAIHPEAHPALLSAILYGLSFLMVSTFPYPSFKELELFRRRPFSTLVGLILIMVVILMELQMTLFLLSALYVLIGPTKVVSKAVQRSRKEALQ